MYAIPSSDASPLMYKGASSNRRPRVAQSLKGSSAWFRSRSSQKARVREHSRLVETVRHNDERVRRLAMLPPSGGPGLRKREDLK